MSIKKKLFIFILFSLYLPLAWAELWIPVEADYQGEPNFETLSNASGFCCSCAVLNTHTSAVLAGGANLDQKNSWSTYLSVAQDRSPQILWSACQKLCNEQSFNQSFSSKISTDSRNCNRLIGAAPLRFDAVANQDSCVGRNLRVSTGQTVHLNICPNTNLTPVIDELIKNSKDELEAEARANRPREVEGFATLGELRSYVESDFDIILRNSCEADLTTWAQNPNAPGSPLRELTRSLQLILVKTDQRLGNRQSQAVAGVPARALQSSAQRRLDQLRREKEQADALASRRRQEEARVAEQARLQAENARREVEARVHAVTLIPDETFRSFRHNLNQLFPTIKNAFQIEESAQNGLRHFDTQTDEQKKLRVSEYISYLNLNLRSFMNNRNSEKAWSQLKTSDFNYFIREGFNKRENSVLKTLFDTHPDQNYRRLILLELLMKERRIHLNDIQNQINPVSAEGSSSRR